MSRRAARKIFSGLQNFDNRLTHSVSKRQAASRQDLVMQTF